MVISEQVFFTKESLINDLCVRNIKCKFGDLDYCPVFHSAVALKYGQGYWKW